MNTQFMNTEMPKINYWIHCSFLCVCIYILTKIHLLLLTEGCRAGRVPGSRKVGHGRTRGSILEVVGFQSTFFVTSDDELCLTRHHEDIPAERKELRRYIGLIFMFTLPFSKSKSH